MAKVIIVGAGGVGQVVAHKCAQVPEVFSEIVLASRTEEKCRRIAAQLERPIATARDFQSGNLRATNGPLDLAIEGAGLEVVETDPGVRGDTSSGGNKPAKTETGAVVRVPLFVQTGERIKVDTRTGEYVSRA